MTQLCREAEVTHANERPDCSATVTRPTKPDRRDLIRVASKCRSNLCLVLSGGGTRRRVLTEQPVLAHDVHLEGDHRSVVIKGGPAGVQAPVLLRHLRLENHGVSFHVDRRAIAPETQSFSSSMRVKRHALTSLSSFQKPVIFAACVLQQSIYGSSA